MMAKIMSLWALIMAVIWISAIREICYAAVDETVDLTTITGSEYSTILSKLREKVTDSKLKYGGTDLPVMTKPTKEGSILIDIKATLGTITIALNTTDLYVQGYADTMNNKARAHFFNDILSSSRASIFPAVKSAKDILVFPFTSSYGSMEGSSGAQIISRTKISLGKNQLNRLINQVYGKAPNAKNEAMLMLVIVQMISEYIRFKYIESLVVENFDTFYNPDPKADSLERNWRDISKGIKDSKNNVMSPALDLLDANGKAWKVSQVDVIAKEMALLKNQEG